MSTTAGLQAIPWQPSSSTKKRSCKVVEYNLGGRGQAARDAVCEELHQAAYSPLVTRAWLHGSTLFVKINTDDVIGDERIALIKERANLLGSNVIPLVLHQSSQIASDNRSRRIRTRGGRPVVPAQRRTSLAFTS